jgi:hypothetical protein
VGRQVGWLGELHLLGQQSLLQRLLLRAGVALRERGQWRSPGTGPHLNGPGPRIVDGGPGRVGPSRRPRCRGGSRGSAGAWSRVAASPTVLLLLVLRLGGATTGPRRATAGRCRLARGASGDKSSGGGNRVLHHVDLLEKELVADGGEGGERAPAPEMDADVLVALVEPTKHVEDQGAVNRNGSVGPGLDRPNEGNADALRGGVALVGGIGGFLLSSLGGGQSSLAEGAASLGVGLRRSIAVLARLIGRIDEGGGRTQPYRCTTSVRRGSGRARGKSPGL